MSKYILIEAFHPNVTRVAVVKNNTLEALDYEFKHQKHLKGNIYIGKVVRVEPSLQAAFIQYDNGKNGFLEISDIHPDYFQPLEDAPQEDLPFLSAPPLSSAAARSSSLEPSERAALLSFTEDPSAVNNPSAESSEDLLPDSVQEKYDELPFIATLDGVSEAVAPAHTAHTRPWAKNARYNIRDVIHPDQRLIVQVSKEEHGTKGATLTTYIAIPGRYCVLFPKGQKNRARYAHQDLETQAFLNQLDLPFPMTLDVSQEVSRDHEFAEAQTDYDYLIGQWKKFEALLQPETSIQLLHEEANLITRIIQNYNVRDVDQIIIDEEETYDLIRAQNVLPSNKIHLHSNQLHSLFHGIEQQIEDLYRPSIPLKSGGSIVINKTEALIAIDVNSGRFQGNSVEQTAFNTNLEAAEEIPRQIRLRNLGGIIVIDFIDMRNTKNTEALEEKFKKSMKGDRARYNITSLTSFYTLTLTRQRLGGSFQESNFAPCPYCSATGYLRTFESLCLYIVRLLKKEALKQQGVYKLSLPNKEALYFLNYKQSDINHLRDRFNLQVLVTIDDSLHLREFRLERLDIKASIDESADTLFYAKQKTVEISKEYGHHPLGIPKNRGSTKSPFQSSSAAARKKPVAVHPHAVSPHSASPYPVSLRQLESTVSMPLDLAAQTVLESFKTLAIRANSSKAVESKIRLTPQKGKKSAAASGLELSLWNFADLKPSTNLKKLLLNSVPERGKSSAYDPKLFQTMSKKGIGALIYRGEKDSLWLALVQNRFNKLVLWTKMVDAEDNPLDVLYHAIKNDLGLMCHVEETIDTQKHLSRSSGENEITYYLARIVDESLPPENNGKIRWIKSDQMNDFSLYNQQRRLINKGLSRIGVLEDKRRGESAPSVSDQESPQPLPPTVTKEEHVKKRIGAIVYRQDQDSLKLAFIQDHQNKWILSTNIVEDEENPLDVVYRTVKGELGLSCHVEREVWKKKYSTKTSKGLTYREITYYLARTDASQEENEKKIRWVKSDEINQLSLSPRHLQAIKTWFSQATEAPPPSEKTENSHPNLESQEKQLKKNGWLKKTFSGWFKTKDNSDE